MEYSHSFLTENNIKIRYNTNMLITENLKFVNPVTMNLPILPIKLNMIPNMDIIFKNNVNPIRLTKFELDSPKTPV